MDKCQWCRRPTNWDDKLHYISNGMAYCHVPTQKVVEALAKLPVGTLDALTLDEQQDFEVNCLWDGEL